VCGFDDKAVNKRNNVMCDRSIALAVRGVKILLVQTYRYD